MPDAAISTAQLLGTLPQENLLPIKNYPMLCVNFLHIRNYSPILVKDTSTTATPRKLPNTCKRL